MTALATSTRPTPNERATASWWTLATVIPQAPESSWAAQSWGAIVVLPCGARAIPWLEVHPASASTLCSRAVLDSVTKGVAKALSVSPAPTTSATVRPHVTGGHPLSRGPTAREASPLTAARSMASFRAGISLL